ncbi:hypothetical protein E1A91_A10G240600v1 [Gossypium mustelinum]|uniref:DC1 domain-containing protein n=1 Tax=Gossypium mustelinum TaxID=34275 RepID=A0A5D2XTI2_GOSMU|nr:hypothetical protein E1A91_A10G240600v1 [Gossypium mustelinum]
MPTLLKIHDLDGHPEHELEWKKSEVPFICNGCKELGFGVCYQCPDMNCNYILHEECRIRRPTPPFQKFFEDCNFQFHPENPLGPRKCDICTLDIQGFLYQCSYGEHNLHPHCTSLPPVISLPDSDMSIYLRRRIQSKCLKCQSKKISSSRVQGLSYVSSDGKLCYHVTCLKQASLEAWKRDYFNLDVNANDEEKSLALQNLSPKLVVRPSGEQNSKAMKGFKLLIKFIKLLFSALLGDHFTLFSTLFQNFS